MGDKDKQSDIYIIILLHFHTVIYRRLPCM